MARSAFWNGYLRLSLVTCKVTLTPAYTQAEKIRFHKVNRATGNRVEQRYVDAETGAVVPPDAQTNGYEAAPDKIVLLEDAEIAAAAIETTHTIDVSGFVPAGSVPWLYYDRPHYLAPADAVSGEAFGVIRAAMAEAGMAGLSRLVLYRREHPLLLVPRDGGMVAWTLRYAAELRALAASEGAPADGDVRRIEAETISWSPALVDDPVEDALRRMISTKRKPGACKAASREAPRGEVIDIMDALRRSLAAERKGGG